MDSGIGGGGSQYSKPVNIVTTSVQAGLVSAQSSIISELPGYSYSGVMEFLREQELRVLERE